MLGLGVHRFVPPTPQYAWPLLRQRLGLPVWVKHENHTPAGAFKVRGGMTYFEPLARREPRLRGVISATRGNHGQSVGWGAQRFGLLNELYAQYEQSFPGLIDKVASSIVGLRIHAARRAEEMDELKRTFNHHGLNSFMAPAVQKVLEAIAALETGKASASGAREGDLQATLELFYQKGLLRLDAESRQR